ncbi:MAG: sulfurtransferase FdhD [Gemmatimonadetes bacterium]|nr:sulfurtransferase FdhD [Gemmatimonadota bacterium]
MRLGYAPPTSIAAGVRIDGDDVSAVEEVLAEETPVTLAYNGASHAVMMATPSDLEDFAIGFSLTEGIVSRREELGAIAVVRYSRGIELQIDVAPEIAERAGTRSRRLSGRTGCGICGSDSVDQVLRELPIVQSTRHITAAAVGRAMRSLAERQPLNASTGAVHAAGWAQADGTLVHVREDVGRHNALDKLVGALMRAGEPAADGFVVITSRGSFEMVQKAAILGVGVLAAVSAPTALAVRVAHATGITLAGFARGDRVTVYTHPERVAR